MERAAAGLRAVVAGLALALTAAGLALTAAGLALLAAGFVDARLAAAVSKPDAYAGELPVAYVQLAPGARSTESELIAAMAAQIAERAAIPKEIIVLEKLPLSDIGKPMKQALRHDIAERTFQSILQAATKLPASMLQLSLAAHPTKGDQLTIRVGHCRLEERRALAARINDAMRPFACPYHIEWAAAVR